MDPAENEFLASLEAKAKQPNPFFRAMAHRPESLKSIRAVLRRGDGLRARRPAHQRARLPDVLHRQRVRVLHAANTPDAQKAGITDDELRALEAEQDHGFSPAERGALLCPLADARRDG